MNTYNFKYVKFIFIYTQLYKVLIIYNIFYSIKE